MGYASTEELSPAQAASVVERAADNASVLEAEEKEMKSFEMQLSHSLLFPLEPIFPSGPSTCVVTHGNRVSS